MILVYAMPEVGEVLDHAGVAEGLVKDFGGRIVSEDCFADRLHQFEMRAERRSRTDRPHPQWFIERRREEFRRRAKEEGPGKEVEFQLPNGLRVEGEVFAKIMVFRVQGASDWNEASSLVEALLSMRVPNVMDHDAHLELLRTRRRAGFHPYQ